MYSFGCNLVHSQYQLGGQNLENSIDRTPSPIDLLGSLAYPSELSECLEPTPVDLSGYHSSSNIHSSKIVRDDVVKLQKTSSGSIQFELSRHIAASLPVSEILHHIKQIIEAKVPNLICQYSNNGFAIEHSTGVQMELEVFEGPLPNYKGLKMRRISGDNLFYNQLCQELISCMNS